MFIDTHSHLSDKAFDDDRAEILAAAFDAGVPFLIDVGCDPAGSRRAAAHAAANDRVYATCGVHPHDAEAFGVAGATGIIEELADHPEVVALGEMGLDFYYDHSPRELQTAVFRAQLDQARSRDMPIVMHVRDAEPEALACLADGGFPKGIWHCFTGDLASAEAAVAGGMYISFSGILTFKRSQAIQAAAKALPLDRLLVETDCPYLAPMPHRGKRNQPAFVNHTGAFLAELRGMTPEALAPILNANARRVFGLEAA